MIAYVYLPKAIAAPYQAVIYCGGLNMLTARTADEVFDRLPEYLVKSGRAVIVPAYYGMLDRGPTPLNVPLSRVRDISVFAVKDVARSMDYLETRSDIDKSKVGYYGLSAGALIGLMALGADTRFKAALLISAGVSGSSGPFPEADPWNYAPRVKIPVLMLNGKEDFVFPVETSQNTLFKALGTPEKDKRHIIYPGGHLDFHDHMDAIKEVLDWMDQYLGPVRK